VEEAMAVLSEQPEVWRDLDWEKGELPGVAEEGS